MHTLALLYVAAAVVGVAPDFGEQKHRLVRQRMGAKPAGCFYCFVPTRYMELQIDEGEGLCRFAR